MERATLNFTWIPPYKYGYIKCHMSKNNKMISQKNKRDRTRDAEKFAHWMDSRFKIPGTDIRFGIDPIISLVPGAGDWLSGVLACYFILLGVKAGVAKSVLFRMGTNIFIDILIGSIPIIGDIFDVGWKANKRNAGLLQQYQSNRRGTETQSKVVLWTIAVVLFLVIIALLVMLGWLLVWLIGLIV